MLQLALEINCTCGLHCVKKIFERILCINIRISPKCRTKKKRKMKWCNVPRDATWFEPISNECRRANHSVIDPITLGRNAFRSISLRYILLQNFHLRFSKIAPKLWLHSSTEGRSIPQHFTTGEYVCAQDVSKWTSFLESQARYPLLLQHMLYLV